MKSLFKVLLLAGATTLSAAAQDKFDAHSHLILDAYARHSADPTVQSPLLKHIRTSNPAARSAEAEATVIVSLEPGYSADDLAALGLEIVSDIDDIVIVSGSMDDIRGLADYDFVKSISFGRESRPMLNDARAAIGVDDIHNGTGLKQAYTGKGVVAGLFDTGLDPQHVNFLDKDFNSRIKRLWVMGGSNGNFTEYKTPDAIKKFQTEKKDETHGTHTLGCMAGSFNGTDTRDGAVVIKEGTPDPFAKTPYYGMAIESELAVAAGELYDPNTISAVKQIVDYANSQKKPVVINLSIGSNWGPHDGTDEVCRALDNMADKGAIICLSAGNEGNVNMSVDKTFTSTDNSMSTFLVLSGSFRGYIDFWSSNSTPFTFTVGVYDRKNNKFIYEYNFSPESSRNVTIGYGGIANANFSKAFKAAESFISLSRSTNSGTNNRYNVSGYSSLSYNPTENAGGNNYAMVIKVTGSAGQRVQGTVSDGAEFTNLNLDGFTKGSSDLSISSIACGKNTISVGAWNSRVKWPVYGGQANYQGMSGFTKDNVAGYSSYGTLLDGRTLPLVCAPGSAIISSISTYYYNELIKDTKMTSGNPYVNGRYNYYMGMQGTSMASPICAGAIALWLEANPYLTHKEVKEIIQKTSNSSNLPAATPQYRWGAGKFDALAGIKYVIENAAGVSDVTIDGKDKLMLTPTGFNSWEVYVPYADSVTADIYTLAGVKVSSGYASGSTLNISADNLAKGIYVISVNGTGAERIAVR